MALLKCFVNLDSFASNDIVLSSEALKRGNLSMNSIEKLK